MQKLKYLFKLTVVSQIFVFSIPLFLFLAGGENLVYGFFKEWTEDQVWLSFGFFELVGILGSFLIVNHKSS